MSDNNHIFTVDLTGLNLSAAQIKEISEAIYDTVISKLAEHQLTGIHSPASGFLKGFGHPIAGLVYLPNRSDLKIE